MQHTAYIGIGSNLGLPGENCKQAIEHLNGHPDIEVIRCSAFYESEPVGVPDQAWFVNTAVKVRTSLDPGPLLLELLAIENEMGRVRLEKWGPRIIDLDLLLYEDRVLQSPELTIPHPEMAHRGFVLLPLCDLDPDFIHPVAKQSLETLLAGLPDDPTVRRLSSP